MMKFAEKKLLESLQEVIERICRENNPGMMKMVVEKNVRQAIFKALRYEKHYLYKRLVESMASIINNEKQNEALFELEKGYLKTLEMVLWYEFKNTTDAMFNVDICIKSMYRILMKEIISGKQGAEKLIEMVIEEATNEYSDRNRKNIVFSLHKYAILAIARVLTQGLRDENYSAVKEDIEKVLNTFIRGIDSDEDVDVEKMLSAIENQIEDWSWEINEGLDRRESESIDLAPDVEMEALIAALAVLVENGAVNDMYFIKNEHERIGSKFSYNRYETHFKNLGEKNKEIVKIIYQKVKAAPGALYQHKSAEAPTVNENVKKIIDSLSEMFKSKSIASGIEKTDINNDNIKIKELEFVYTKFLPRAIFQDEQKYISYVDYGKRIANDIRRVIWDKAIEYYKRNGDSISLEDVFERTEPILGYFTRKFASKIRKRNNEKDKLERLSQKADYLEVISNSVDDILSIQCTEKDIQLVPVSYRTAKDHIIASIDEYYMYGELDYEDKSMIEKLVVQLKVCISMKLVVQNMIYCTNRTDDQAVLD